MAKKPPTESSPSIGSITQASGKRTRALEKLLGPPAKSEAKRGRASTGCGCSICRPPEKVRRFLAKKFQRDLDEENLRAIEILTRGRKRPPH
jgi:hypothetical protein